MNKFIPLAQAILDTQAFSKFPGARITAIKSQEVELQLAVADHLKQQQGFVYGGVLSHLADGSLTFADGMALGPVLLHLRIQDQLFTTCNRSTSYRQSVRSVRW